MRERSLLAGRRSRVAGVAIIVVLLALAGLTPSALAAQRPGPAQQYSQARALLGQIPKSAFARGRRSILLRRARGGAGVVRGKKPCPAVRAVDAVRSWNAKLGPDATWLACSHADIIKAVVADALGMHLDTFQRIVIDPCSVTVISYTSLRPFVVRVNDTGTDLASLLTPPKRSGRRRSATTGSDAVVGGGAGAN